MLIKMRGLENLGVLSENPSVGSSILPWPTMKLYALPKKEGFFSPSFFTATSIKGN